MSAILIDERKTIKGTCKLFMTGAHSFYVDREYIENDVDREYIENDVGGEEGHNVLRGTRTVCQSSDSAEYEWNKAKKEFCA